jgi:hypothetical protein
MMIVIITGNGRKTDVDAQNVPFMTRSFADMYVALLKFGDSFFWGGGRMFYHCLYPPNPVYNSGAIGLICYSS